MPTRFSAVGWVSRRRNPTNKVWNVGFINRLPEKWISGSLLIVLAWGVCGTHARGWNNSNGVRAYGAHPTRPSKKQYSGLNLNQDKAVSRRQYR